MFMWYTMPLSSHSNIFVIQYLLFFRFFSSIVIHNVFLFFLFFVLLVPAFMLPTYKINCKLSALPLFVPFDHITTAMPMKHGIHSTFTITIVTTLFILNSLNEREEKERTVNWLFSLNDISTCVALVTRPIHDSNFEC